MLGAGKAGLESADEAAARLRENARAMHERAAEAKTGLQSIHVRCAMSFNSAACVCSFTCLC